ncbi:hypothetical protein MKW94_004059, partial [Papaver nudicaule]|nr:hypothetical protein [Papaver nudicaule]
MDFFSILPEPINGFGNLSFFSISVPVLVFSIFFLCKIPKVWSSSSGESQLTHNLPPSPPKLPIIGNLHQLGKLVHRSFRDLSQKYGPVMYLHLFQSPILVVSSVEMAEEIMKNQDIIFANRPLSIATNALVYGSTDIVLAPYGEYWRQMKKICTVELLSLKRVQSFKHVREEEVDIVIQKIASSCSSSREDGAQVVNLTEMLLSLSNNVVSRCCLGVRYETAHGNRFPKLSSEYLGLLNAFCFGDFFPSLGWVDVVTGLHSKFKKVFRELDTFLDQTIDEHLLRRSESQDDHGQVEVTNKLDLTDILILCQEDNKNLSRNNIKAVLL